MLPDYLFCKRMNCKLMTVLKENSQYYSVCDASCVGILTCTRGKEDKTLGETGYILDCFNCQTEKHKPEKCIYYLERLMEK